MRLSIIIPVYNEERTIEEILRRVDSVELIEDVKKEIIVVDDASKDSSMDKVQSAMKMHKIKNIELLKHKVNKGKGAAVVTGMKESSGEMIIVQDADLEYNPEDINRLLEPVMKGKSKVVYGSRLKDYPLRIVGQKKTPLITHYIGNKFLTFITNLLYESNLTDMETCYKLFKREVVEDMKINARRFDFEPEITAKILKSGFKIKEVPIKVKPRGYDEGKKISWRDGFIAVWTLFKYKFVD